jgi:hypothetical protein
MTTKLYTYDARGFFDADLRTRLAALRDMQQIIAAGLSLIAVDNRDIPDIDDDWAFCVEGSAKMAADLAGALGAIIEEVA